VCYLWATTEAAMLAQCVARTIIFLTPWHFLLIHCIQCSFNVFPILHVFSTHDNFQEHDPHM
jgi:hypothetical protein